MKIDIHITDATPEEAAIIFCGISVQKAAESVVKKIVQKKAVPDPKPGQTGCEGCSPAPAVKKPDMRHLHPSKNGGREKVKKGNKYGIPASLFSEDKRKYQRLDARCRTHGVTYEQALEMEKMIRPGKVHADTVKQSAQAIASSNDVKEPVCALTMDKCSASENVIGFRVRQIKPDHGRLFSGIGVVVARHNGIIEVRNGNAKTHKIDARYLAIVTGDQQASDRATGASS